MSMNRRGLLGLLLGAPLAVKTALSGAPAYDFGPPIHDVVIEPVKGFGLLAEKTEGRVLLYESNHPTALWPGIQAWWAREYEQAEARGFDSLTDMWETDDDPS